MVAAFDFACTHTQATKQQENLIIPHRISLLLDTVGVRKVRVHNLLFTGTNAVLHFLHKLFLVLRIPENNMTVT